MKQIRIFILHSVPFEVFKQIVFWINQGEHIGILKISINAVCRELNFSKDCPI